MSHPRRETNPHFIRLQSQDRLLGSPPNPRHRDAPHRVDGRPPPRRSNNADQQNDPSSTHPYGITPIGLRHPDESDPIDNRPPPRRSDNADHQNDPPPSGPFGIAMVGPRDNEDGRVDPRRGRKDGRGDPRRQPRRPPVQPPLPSPPRHPPSTPMSPEELRPPRRSPPPAAKAPPLSPDWPLPTPGRHYPHNGPRIPPPKRTNPLAWSAAVCCAIFWVIIILGGLIVLIVYLLYRPHSPRFDITSANLNAAYLDMGFLLNADLTFLANFTNPSRKGTIKFGYVTFELYYYNTLIATQYIEPFSARKAHSMFANVHLVSSQVRLPAAQIQELKRQMERNGVTFDVRGKFHAIANLGSLLRYSYWLHSHCTILVAGPPAGVMRGKRCVTKR